MGDHRRELTTARAVAVAALVGGGAFLAVALAASLSGWTSTTRTLAAAGMAAMAVGAALLLAAPGLYLPDPSPARRFAQVALPVGLLAVLAPAAAGLTVRALPLGEDVVTSGFLTRNPDAPPDDPEAHQHALEEWVAATSTTIGQWPPPPAAQGGGAASRNIDADLGGGIRQAVASTTAPAASDDGHAHSGSTVPGEGDAAWAEEVQAEVSGAVQAALGGRPSVPTTVAPGAAPAGVTPSSVAPGAFAGEELADHGHEVVPEQPLDPATRAVLGEQLVLARDVAMRYSTVADAEAAGYRKVTGYVPLIGAHYVKWGAMDARFDVAEPEMLLYDGEEADSRIVGLSYYVFGATAPDGFAGPNDHWHQHRGLCLRDLVVVGGETISEAECAARGGTKVEGANGWMVHAWVVPGWDSPQGVFSPEHLGLV
jgi:hypothetical protein